MYWHRKLAYYRGVTTQTDGRGGGLGEQSLIVRPVTMLMLYILIVKRPCMIIRT